MTGPTSKPHRIVVDTNILVGAAYRAGSSSARIVAACLDGRLEAVVSPALEAEYRHILPRAVRRGDIAAWLDGFLARAVVVHPESEPNATPFDPSDNHLFAAALAGQALAIVTNDRPVLQLGSFAGVSVVRPGAFAASLDEGSPLDAGGESG